MAERQTIVLVESGYLLQAGIELLIQEMPPMTITATFEGTEKKLPEKIMASKPDVVMINPTALKGRLITVVNQLNKSGTCLVGLVNETTPANLCSPFTFCLNTSDEKYDLLETLKKIAGTKPPLPGRQKAATTLSERETTILKQVVSGLTNQEIADKFFLSIHTITTHRKNISRKTGIKTVSGLTVYALMNKIVEMSDIEQK